LTMAWTPGHEGIDGNEAADRAAKLAASGPGATSDRRQLPRFLRKSLPLSSSALKQHHTKSLRNRWTELWQASPRYHRYSHLD
ncbi:hypothetical protein AURDEDRAFT_19683, partial [Auricularia subglabra TFB-10046 SS5]